MVRAWMRMAVQRFESSNHLKSPTKSSVGGTAECRQGGDGDRPGCVAQLEEQNPVKVKVVGSSPTAVAS